MGFLNGKHILVVGIASNRSIAYGIAQACRREGAILALTYQNDKLKERVETMGAELGAECILPCDLSDDTQIDSLFQALNNRWDNLDGIVHSAAYAPADQLDGDYVDCTTREGFKIAHDVSSYSLVALAKAGRSLMKKSGGSIVTLTYLGAERAVPNYNVMGLAKASLEANVRAMASSLGPDQIRVNAISAGPIRTLAASGIKDFRKMLSRNEAVAPLRKNITIEDVGNSAAFLLSDLAGAITGEVLHVDAGFHAIAMTELA
jgi:enoyl-[acyl-carrier protein] reductase I